MFDSLRGRLLLWYTAMLAIVIVVFGALVCYLAWRSRLADIDASLRTRADTLARALQPAAAGTFDLTLPPAGTADAGEPPYHVLWTASGVPIDRSDPGLEIPRPAAPGARTREGRRELAVRAASGATVLTGRLLTDARAEIWSLAGMMAAVGGLAIALSLAGGWWLVGRALRPIDRISRTARSMVEGDFAARIPIDHVETELGQLARALNEAFDRLRLSLDRQRRFTADASHELRTPLATISTEAQWALAREREPADYRRAIEGSQRAAARMQSVVERLLVLARAELAPQDDARHEPVQLDAIVHLVAQDLRPLAAAREHRVAVDAEPVTVTGDPDRLQDAVTNVVANAIQYTQKGGEVRIVLTRRAGQAELVVADTGVGISADDLAFVFEPFFRADPARSRNAGGAGLGLAVTRAIVGQHGGTISCDSTPGHGTTVTIRLPAPQA